MQVGDKGPHVDCLALAAAAAVVVVVAAAVYPWEVSNG